jgi:hypothetical protein
MQMKAQLMVLQCLGQLAWQHARRVLLPQPAVAPDERGMLVIHRDPDTQPEAGLSRLAIEVILVAVGVILVLIVAVLLGDEIVALAQRVAGQIRGSDQIQWGQ